jgi:DNA polymerase I
LYRSFTSLPQAITAGDGRPINAVYGLLNFLLRALREHDTDRMVLALDTPDTPTFRHELYPSYQGQRGPLGGEDAPEFARQVEIAKSVAEALGIVVLARAGYEADDVMGSCGVAVAETSDEAIIVSTDRDLLQLVRPGIEVLSPTNPPIHARSSADVMQRLGVAPEGVTTFKALAGDASDNIPGVKGIGTKTAAMLVNRHGTLEEIFAHLDALPPNTARKLNDGRDDAFLFRRIVTVVTDLDVPLERVRSAHASFGPDDRARALLDRVGYGKT